MFRIDRCMSVALNIRSIVYAIYFQYLYHDIVFRRNQQDIHTRRKNFQHLNIDLHFHMDQNHTVTLKLKTNMI